MINLQNIQVANNDIFLFHKLNDFSCLSYSTPYGRVDRTEVKTPSTLPTKLPLSVYNACLSRFKKCFQMVTQPMMVLLRRLSLFYITITMEALV